jgi:hypothetical protein
MRYMLKVNNNILEEWVCQKKNILEEWKMAYHQEWLLPQELGKESIS